MKLLKKVFRVLSERPTQFWDHVRSAYYFYQTYLLRNLFLNGKKQFEFGENLRIQAFKTLVAESSAKIILRDNSIIYELARIEAYGKGVVELGENSIVGDAKIISRNHIKIGKNFLTSWNVFIQDFDPHPVKGSDRAIQVDMMCEGFYPQFKAMKPSKVLIWEFSSEPITIGDNAWLGANVTILKGAQVGNNCIIASGAVVLKGIYPDNSIIAGNPARVVKEIN